MDPRYILTFLKNFKKVSSIPNFLTDPKATRSNKMIPQAKINNENDKKYANKNRFLRIILLKPPLKYSILIIGKEIIPTQTKGKNQMTTTSKTKATKATKTQDINDLVLKDLMAKYTTKSGTIRFLTAQNFTRSQISKFMGIRYQHVRNVQVQDIEKQERAAVEDTKTKATKATK